VDEHPVFEVPVQGAREHGPLDVAPDHLQHLRVGAMGHAPDVLLDDRPLVEVLGGVTGRGPDELHPPVVNAGGNEWWMLMTGAPMRARKSPDRICM
jgi:hypothetical protein